MMNSCLRIFDRLHLGVASLLVISFIGVGPDISSHDAVSVRAQSYSVLLTATIDTSSSTVGVADSSLYFMDVDELTRAMDELQALGVTQIRVFLPWRAIEPSDGSYDWTQADQLLDMAESYGIAVVASVTSTPTWASDYGGLVANGEPTSSDAYADFVGALAERYGTAANDGEAKIAAYEIWNEPNGFTGWYPEPDAEKYTELLKAAYTAIKAVDPSATVIGGVLGTGLSIGTLTVNPVTFLTEMYEAGAAGYFDALSFHPYNYTSTFSEGSTFANSAIKQLSELREIMIANGDADKLIWVTEYGQPSTQVSEENQAAYIADFLETWSELTGVGPAFLYSLVDTATGSDTAEDNLGLFTDDWTAKAVVEVIKAWIAGEYTSPDPGEAGAEGSLAELLSSLVRAAQSFVAGITAMVASAVDGVTEFVRGVVDAVVGLVNSLRPAGTSTVATARTAAMTADTQTTATTTTTMTAADATADTQTADTLSTTTGSVAAVAGDTGDTSATADEASASDAQPATAADTTEPAEPAEPAATAEPADPSGVVDAPAPDEPAAPAADDDQLTPAATDAAEEPTEATGTSERPFRPHGRQAAGPLTQTAGSDTDRRVVRSATRPRADQG